MNKDNAKDYLPLVKALSEARLEFKACDGDWVRATHHNISFSGPPTDYRIIGSEPEPEKWVACGKNYVSGYTDMKCQLPAGHKGPHGTGKPIGTLLGHCINCTCPSCIDVRDKARPEQESTPTCVHCGKDPFVKSQEEADADAYSAWMLKTKCYETRVVWDAALAYARKEK